MATKLGTNWWSQQWLRALEALDHYGRLPRGKTYFNKGKVLKAGLDPDTLTLHGIVDGSAYTPYETSIQLQPLPKEDEDRLVAAIAERPRLLAKLLKGEVPEELGRLCEELNIKLFPDSWKFMTMSCTCPDVAVPCKHIAATYFTLIRTMDIDPFWVFYCRGINLPERLKDLGIDLDAAESSKDLSWLDYWHNDLFDKPEPFKESLKELPYYQLTNQSQALTSLFVTAPDAKQSWLKRRWWVKQYRKISEGARSRRSSPHTWREFLSDNGMSENALPVLTIDETGFVWQLKDGRKKLHPLNDANAAAFLDSLLCRQVFPESTSSTMRFWVSLRELAQQLLEKGALLPGLVRLTRKDMEGVQLAWFPAIQIETVARFLSSFEHALESDRRAVAPYFNFGENAVFSRHEPGEVFVALAAMLSTLASQFLELTLTEQRDKVLTTSLLYRDFMASGVQADTIRQWRTLLQPFSFEHKTLDFTPVITVRSLPQGQLSINLGIQEKSTAEGDESKESKPILYKKILTEPAYESRRYATISLFESLGQVCHDIMPIVESGGQPARLERSDLTEFLFESVPALKLMGVTVMLPKRLQKLLRPKLMSEVKSPRGGVSLLSRDAVTEYDWRLSIGGKEISQEEFEALCQHVGEVIPWNEDFVYLDAELIESMKAALEAPQEISKIDLLKASMTGEFMGFETKLSGNILKEIKRINQVKELPAPKSLNAKLRPYQERGFAWLAKNVELGVGSLIADDMGLGKTLQVISLMLSLKEKDDLKTPVLAILPTTLIANWEKELKKFAPTLSFHVYHGQGRVMNRNCDVVLTSYGTARRDATKLAKTPWRLLILDEAQAVKNPDSETVKALHRLKAGNVVAMTGTPVENRLMEYWSIFSFVEPALLGDAKTFSDRYAQRIEQEHDPKVAEEFKQLTSPFMLRRLKTDKSIINDLPEKTVNDHYVPLRPEQAALYSQTLDETLRLLDSSENGGKKQALVLGLMTKLKQICNSPSQFQGTTPPVAPDSGKGEALMDLLDSAREAGRKVLIFTQFREMGERLQTWIENATGQRPDFLHGGVSLAGRTKMVERFQNDESVPVMIVSLKAGGTGLNLVAATVVVHYDLWWNPAVENQATDRAYRIGQKEAVDVYRFITSGTFEEKINDLLQAKSTLANLTVGVGESWLGDLSTDDLKSLLRLQ